MLAGRKEFAAKLKGDATMLGIVIDDRWQNLKMTIGLAAPPELLDETKKTLEQIILQFDKKLKPKTQQWLGLHVLWRSFLPCSQFGCFVACKESRTPPTTLPAQVKRALLWTHQDAKTKIDEHLDRGSVIVHG